MTRPLRICRRLLAALAAACILWAAAEAAARGVLFLRARANAGGQDEFTLYALGGSTTQGQPFGTEPSPYNFPVVVREMFGGRVQGRPIAVRNLAAGGESIFYQWRRLRAATAFRRGPGAVLVYAGVEPGGPRPDAESGPAARAWDWWERRVVSRSFALTDLLYLSREARRWAAERLGPSWRWGFSMSSYEFYLQDSAHVARARGLVPVLSTVVCNLADMEPNFALAQRTDPGEGGVAAGRGLERAGRWREALAHYRALAESGPALEPYLHYRMAKCEAALGRWAEARRSYARAADADTQDRFVRPTRAQNEVVRRAAAESGALLSDAAALFERSSRHGLVGRELFMDFHHPNVRGVHLLARSFAEALGPAVGERPRGLDWDEAELRRRFGLDDRRMLQPWLSSGMLLLECACALYPWPNDRLAMAERAFSEALRISPENERARQGLALVRAPAGKALLRDRQAMTSVLLDLRASAGGQYSASSLGRRGWPGREAPPPASATRGPGPLGRAWRRLLDKVAPSPDERRRLLILRLEREGKREQALAEAQALARRDRANVDDLLVVLRLAQAAGRTEAAQDCVARLSGLRLDDNQTALTAEACSRLGRADLALRLIDLRLREAPRSARLWNDRAVAQARAGRLREAAGDAEKAVALDPDLGAGCLTLGTLRWRLGDRARAAAVWRRALARPRLSGGPGVRAQIEESLARSAD